MSARTRELPRRSCLSVPGSSEKMLAKAPGLGSDMVFMDLEDSVAPLEKEAAHGKVVDAIKNQDWGDKVVCVRINAWDTPWTVFDVVEVVGNAGERLEEVMLPKVQTAAEVVALDLVLSQVEARAGLSDGHIGIEAQIETARGLINVEEICAASPRLETIIFGPADFAASIEMPVLTGGVQIPEYPGDHFHYVFSKILMAGRANGLQVIDGPFLKIHDQDAFRDYCQRTKVLGYDGKWALHPDQVTILNELFSPTQEQFDRAWDILEAYEVATEGDRKGAVMFGDEMIDEASRKMAIKFVSRGTRAGFTRSLIAARFDAVLFDAGGVLVMPDPTVLAPLLAPLGGSVDPAVHHRAHYAAIRAVDRSEDEDWTQYHRAYVATVGVPADELEEAFVLFSSTFNLHLWRYPNDGSAAVLHTLVQRNIPIGVVSNAGGQIEGVLARAGVCQVGEGSGAGVLCVVDSHIVGVSKPDPGIFVSAVEALGIERDRIAYVGDSIRYDVRGATAAGLTPLLLDPYGDAGDDGHERILALTDLLELV